MGLIPARAYKIWELLTRRFDLEPRPATASPPQISDIIVPVTQADVVLSEGKAFTASCDLTGAASAHVVAATVPDLKRWRITHIWRGASTGSTRIDCVVAGARIEVTTLGTGEAPLAVDLTMNAGDTIGMREDNNGADGAIGISAWYVEEDV